MCWPPHAPPAWWPWKGGGEVLGKRKARFSSPRLQDEGLEVMMGLSCALGCPPARRSAGGHGRGGKASCPLRLSFLSVSRPTSEGGEGPPASGAGAASGPSVRPCEGLFGEQGGAGGGPGAPRPPRFGQGRGAPVGGKEGPWPPLATRARGTRVSTSRAFWAPSWISAWAARRAPPGSKARVRPESPRRGGGSAGPAAACPPAA